MNGPRVEDQVAAYLIGDLRTHETIRRAVGVVVRAFRFAGRGIAEELVQETMARVFVNLSAGAFRGESSLVTYSQRIARYVCLEQIRKRRFAAEVDPAGLVRPDPSPEPEARLLRTEEHRRNLALLAALSPACRELFRLIFVDGLSYAQVAERLGVSETAVKLRVHRCRLTIRSARTESAPAGISALPSAAWRHHHEEGE
jgi:RNA polymerase sigma-70 factor (ECF subfamily)